MNREPRQIYKDQVFDRIGTVPYINRKGREMVLDIWQSKCLKCGTGYTFMHQQRGEFSPRRNCDEHKKPTTNFRKDHVRSETK